MRPRRGLAGAAATLAATLVALGLTAPESVAAGGRCAPGTGVTVVVDYAALGGGVVIACVPDGGGKSAAEVVTDAGFDLAYVSSQPGFVCRIDGRPGEADEDCGDTPPADAYWGLFWSDADPATWAYSSEGAGSLDVPAGGSIGWRFQDGGDREDPGAPPTGKAKTPSPQPTKSPQPAGPSDAASPSPTPTPQASVPPGAGGSATGTPGEKANPEADKPGPKASGDKGDKAGKTGDDTEGKGKGEGKDNQPPDKAHPEQAAAPEPSPSVAALSPASGEPLTDDDDSSAPLTLVAGAAVLLLAATAGVIAWRRRG